MNLTLSYEIGDLPVSKQNKNKLRYKESRNKRQKIVLEQMALIKEFHL